MFAADLYEVLMQRGKQPVYEKPENFFGLTFPTHNLRNLVPRRGAALANKNDKAVRQLELTYGGGKTHTLITLHHLVQDPDSSAGPASRPGVHAGHRPETTARPAWPGCVSTSWTSRKGWTSAARPGKTRRLKHPWSVLAYQLAGDDGLKRIARRGQGRGADDRAGREHAHRTCWNFPARRDLASWCSWTKC